MDASVIRQNAGLMSEKEFLSIKAGVWLAADMQEVEWWDSENGIVLRYEPAGLTPEVQSDLLTTIAEHMTLISDAPQNDAIRALLLAASVVAIRSAPLGSGVAPEFQTLVQEAMKSARAITSAP